MNESKRNTSLKKCVLSCDLKLDVFWSWNPVIHKSQRLPLKL